VANGRSIGLIIIINIIYAKLDCHTTKTKYRTGLNAAPDMIIIHLSSIKPKNEKCAEKREKHSNITKHHIVNTKQGNSGTHVGLQII